MQRLARPLSLGDALGDTTKQGHRHGLQPNR